MLPSPPARRAAKRSAPDRPARARKRAALREIGNEPPRAPSEDACECPPPRPPSESGLVSSLMVFTVSEPREELLRNLQAMELHAQPDPHYLQREGAMTELTRSVLVDWLIGLHDRLSLSPSTLFLTLNLLERFLSTRNIADKSLRLVASAALLLSAKYNGDGRFRPRDVVVLASRAFSVQDLLRVESVVARETGFRMSSPTIQDFLLLYLEMAQQPELAETCIYLLDRALHAVALLLYRPSTLALASLFAAERVTGLSDVPSRVLAEHFGVDRKRLAACASMLVDCVAHPVIHEIVFASRRSSAAQHTVHKYKNSEVPASVARGVAALSSAASAALSASPPAPSPAFRSSPSSSSSSSSSPSVSRSPLWSVGSRRGPAARDPRGSAAGVAQTRFSGPSVRPG